MGGLNTSLLAATGLVVTFAVGWGALHLARAALDYMSARGNPRNRGQANDSMIDVFKGLGLAGAAAAISALIFATIKI